MKTTEVIVEILVIGFGPLLIVVVWGESSSNSASNQLLNMHPSLVIVVGSIFCYVAGIVVDRVADFVFSFYEDKIRTDVLTKFGMRSADFQGMRSYVYNEIPHIMTWAEYGLSLIHISEPTRPY